MKPSDLTKRQRQQLAAVLKKAIEHFERRRDNRDNNMWGPTPSSICTFMLDMLLPNEIDAYIQDRLPDTTQRVHGDGYCWDRYNKRGITARINWLKRQLREVNQSL